MALMATIWSPTVQRATGYQAGTGKKRLLGDRISSLEYTPEAQGSFRIDMTNTTYNQTDDTSMSFPLLTATPSTAKALDVHSQIISCTQIIATTPRPQSTLVAGAIVKSKDKKQ